MNKEQVARDVLSQLSGVDAAKIEPKMDLVADLGIDSPKALQLLVELEDRLSIEISDEAAARMDTAGDIFDFLATA